MEVLNKIPENLIKSRQNFPYGQIKLLKSSYLVVFLISSHYRLYERKKKCMLHSQKHRFTCQCAIVPIACWSMRKLMIIQCNFWFSFFWENKIKRKERWSDLWCDVTWYLFMKGSENNEQHGSVVNKISSMDISKWLKFSKRKTISNWI